MGLLSHCRWDIVSGTTNAQEEPVWQPKETEWLEFFFRTMSGPESYAGGGKAVPIPNLPGWKGFDVKEGGFRLIDQYTDTGSGLTAGLTIVLEGSNTRLLMNYCGHYPTEASAALREVLLATYSDRLFCGGRGRDGTRRNGYVYYNRRDEIESFLPNVRLGFRSASGLESMKKIGAAGMAGYHTYNYMISDPDS